MTALQLTTNVLGWPLIHLGVAFAFLHIPKRHFLHDSWLTTSRGWERNGTVYRKLFKVTRWKAKLPDAAPRLGGFSKKRLNGKDRTYLEEFLLETRRAEIAHWCMIGFLPVFFLWNPCWASCVMAAYAVTSNLPCIVVQRYNRIALARMLGNVRRVRVIA